ncbi:glycosyltransferase [Candidatus Giovannonibacteria bacterium]|nr:glycosyltransferase [Candidatus Giovannonibacteria bacterium]
MGEKVSVVVPTLNEEGNVAELVSRIDAAFFSAGLFYELIFIDDFSSDGTLYELEKLSKKFPLRYFLKRGKRGKAFSLLEGFEYAEADTLAFIDADLQYPPESLPLMARKVMKGESDIIVARRQKRNESALRNFISKCFSFIFSRMLHGLDADVQSGLKVFKKKILREIYLEPSAWTFDLEFLIKARNAGYSAGSVDILFEERKYGESKIKLLRNAAEIGLSALLLRLEKKTPAAIPPDDGFPMRGAGVAHRGKRFITHTTLSREYSAFETFTGWQKTLLAMFIAAAAGGFFYFPLRTALYLATAVSFLYFLDVLVNFYLISKSLAEPQEMHFTDSELLLVSGDLLPAYSILCPLYKESAVLPDFLNSIYLLDWPKEKLDVLLLLEEDDLETIFAAQKINLPDYVRIIVVPHSEPKTKPKACNYGLSWVRGEYVVIYDAEDQPEPAQLKKAYLGFKRSPAEIKCLQAKLNYYNPEQNILTRIFTAEYSLWFDIMLPGLQSVNAFIPLGGTSNHFRTRDLMTLEGWDPFNVTEDCDLGARLFELGYKTAIIDSVTLEEANSRVANWMRQRSRWLKGYMQTFLVHSRRPSRLLKERGFKAFLLQAVIGGKIAFSFLNIFVWLSTISYFVLYSIVGEAIERIYPVYPVPVLYMAGFAMVFGNFMYFYNYMIGCAKCGQWSLLKYVYLVPVYWVLMSAAGFMALYQLITRPHFWEKTVHGFHLAQIPPASVSAVSEPSERLIHASRKLRILRT